MSEVVRERAQSFLRPEHQQRILSAYKVFADVPGFAKVATLPEISVNGSAHWEPVPKNYRLVNADGDELLGVATKNQVEDRDASAHLFGAIINRLEASLPEQLLCSEGDYTVLQLKIPQEPLMITTVVIEQDDGRLVPALSPSR